MLKLIKVLWPVSSVLGSVALLIVEMSFCLFALSIERCHLVEVRQGSCVRSEVISLGWLEIMSMGEGGHLTSSKVQNLLRESIPNSIWLLSVNESKHVILDNWALRLDSALSSGQISSNAVTKGEDVLILLVLQSVLVHIDHAGRVSDASIHQELVRL